MRRLGGDRAGEIGLSRFLRNAAVTTPETAAALRLRPVDLREVDPPEDVAGEADRNTDQEAGKPSTTGRRERLHRRLLTTHPVGDLPEAPAAAALCRRRRAIQDLVRPLKTKGFDIEALRIGDDAPRAKLVMAAPVAAVGVQQPVHARHGDPAKGPLRPVTDLCDPDDIPLIEALNASREGKTQRQKNPRPRQSLAYAARVCARLGGWTGYYGKPGPVVMRDGWLELQAAKRAARAIKACYDA